MENIRDTGHQCPVNMVRIVLNDRQSVSRFVSFYFFFLFSFALEVLNNNCIMNTIFRENNAPKMVIQKKLIESINRLFSLSLSIQFVFIESRNRET